MTHGMARHVTAQARWVVLAASEAERAALAATVEAVTRLKTD